MRGGEWGWETPALNATKLLLFCKFYGHKTWQGNFLWSWQLTHYLTWPSEQVVTWGHMTNWKVNISSSKRSMGTKFFMALWPRSHLTNWKQNIFSCTTAATTRLGRMVTYNEKNTSIVSYEPLTTRLHGFTWQIKNKISPLPPALWLPN